MIAITVPLPAELRPMTKPVVAPIPAAATLWRVCISKSSRSAIALARKRLRRRVIAPTTSRQAARIAKTVSSRSSPSLSWSWSSAQTPAIAEGTLPAAIHQVRGTFTVFSFRCRQPPAVFVIAA
jgi:hypothetical protein